jgi:hypothetical protein
MSSFKTAGLIGLNSITHMPTGRCNESFCKQERKQPIMEKRLTPEVSGPSRHLGFKPVL